MATQRASTLTVSAGTPPVVNFNAIVVFPAFPRHLVYRGRRIAEDLAVDATVHVIKAT